MMIILVTGNNYLVMFVGWEGVGICSYLLVSFWFTRISANQSSMSAFLTNRVGDYCLTIGMFAILWALGKEQKMFKLLKCEKASLPCVAKNKNTLNISYRQVRKYSTLRPASLIDPYFVTGFTDGEFSPFSIGIVQSSKSKLGWSVELKFVINFNDQSLLKLIKASFGCGTITEYRMNKFIYSVESLSELGIILNHFDKYPLITQKLAMDFLLFKRAYEIVKCRKHLTVKDLKEVLSLKVSIDNKAAKAELTPLLGDSSLTKDLVPVPMVEIDRKIHDPNWLSGFVSREGYFIIDIRYSTDKVLKQVMLKFKISVNNRDKNLLKSLPCYLGSGSFYSRASRKTGDFRVQKVNDVFNIVIPLFQKYPLRGVKGNNFLDFCRIAELIKNKAHLTKPGLEEIVRIKSGMNQVIDLSLTTENPSFASFASNKKVGSLVLGSNLNMGVCCSELPYLASGNNTQKAHVLKGSSHLGSYLAGLIEGDGHIAVHDKNSKSKVYRPKIIIAFNIHDKPLADKISAELKVGKVISKPKAGHVLLQILAKQEVLNIMNLINGYMRTPKIEALHRAINWINEIDNSCIPCLGLDLSPVDSTNWLAGFTDADGCFGLSIYDRKKNGVFLRTSVQTSFRIEVKQNYSREVTFDQGGASYFHILSEIAAFFTVNLYTRTRKTEDKVYYAFVAMAHNSRSHEIVRKYFDRFPLYSSKYLAYKDWCLVQDIKKAPLTKENLDKIKIIKNNFNSKRKVFDFSHLDSFAMK